MTSWDERLQDHAVNPGISKVLDLIDQVAAKEELDLQAREQLARMRSVTQFLQRTLERAEPALLPLASLNNCTTYLDNIAAEMTQFMSNGNLAHLTSANGHADRVLQQIPSVRTAEVPDDIAGVREAVVSFRQSAGQHLRHLTDEAERLRSLLSTMSTSATEVQAEIKAQKSRLDTAIAEFQNQFSQATSQRAEQFQQAEQKRLEAATETLGSTKSQLVALIAEHSDLLTSLHDTQDTEFSEFIATSSQSSTELQESIREAGAQQMDEIEALKAEAEKIVGVIASTGMAGGYQKIADGEHRSALVFQITTVVSIVGLIVFAVWAFLNVASGGFDAGMFAAKAFAAISFGILAGYAARQAERHQSNERYHRKMELELTAIGPYVAALPEETQMEVRRELAQKMFGREVTLGPAKAKDTTGTTADLLRLALESLHQLAGK